MGWSSHSLVNGVNGGLQVSLMLCNLFVGAADENLHIVAYIISYMLLSGHL